MQLIKISCIKLIKLIKKNLDSLTAFMTQGTKTWPCNKQFLYGALT